MRWCEEEESQGLPRGQASQQTYFFSFALFPAISSFAAAPSLEPRPRRQAPAASGGGRQVSWSPHRCEHRPVQPTPAFFSTRNTKTAFVQPEICTGSGNVLNPSGDFTLSSQEAPSRGSNEVTDSLTSLVNPQTAQIHSKEFSHATPSV